MASTRLNPPEIAKPASHYSHGVLVPASATRLLISGQVGVQPDGVVADGLAAQIEQAFANLEAVLAAAGMGVGDLVKITAFMVPADGVGLFRAIRDRRLLGHAPACTYVQVAGLASPAFLFELEGEAAKETGP
jgi:enamine deaminase RidA (YjgF/YER057c/UK114 family)